MEEQKKEERKDIVVLDKGINLTAENGPEWMCCFGALTPLRA